MSTFTQWNGPQSTSGPSTKDIINLIEAYNNLSTKLAAHIEAVAPTDTTVHGIVVYVKEIKSELEALIGGKATITALNDVKATAESAATQNALSSAVQNLNELIANKADKSALSSKTDNTTTTAIQSALSVLTNIVDNLKAKYEAHAAHITDTITQLAFDCAIKSATYIIGKLKAFKIIDFTKWAHFSAPFAGTGGISDTSTNGAFILGCLSLNWDDDNAPAEEYSHKAARAYVKYVNSNPFDAICDMVVSKTDEGYVGSLTVHLAKKANTWKDLAFHLLLGTNSKHTECVYLAVSASGLSSTSGDYPNTNFRACGENFLPVGEDGYVTPSGMLKGITSAVIGTNADSITGIDNLRLNQLWSPNYFDGDGYNLLRVVSKIDPDDESTYRQVFIGDPKYDEITFIKRPSMIVQNTEGKEIQAYFVTAQDIINVALPVGAIIRWAPVDANNNLKNIPTGYLACDGAQVSNTEYPELCELLGYDEYGMSILPNESHSIIKAVYFDIIDKSAQPDYDGLVEFSMLSKKINKEITRAKETEFGLSERITVNAGNITAEIERATAAEQANASAITAETSRAIEAEQANASAITAEIERATAAEQSIVTGLDTANTNIAANTAIIEAEAARAQGIEEELQDTIEIEVTRATAAEQANASAIAAEIERATAAEQANASAIAAETSRAIEAETTLNTRVNHYEIMENRLQANIDTEAARATAKEAELEANISAEETRAMQAETALNDIITAEATRAEAAETTLQSNIDTETERATAAEETNAAAIATETERATAAEETNAAAIATETERATAAEEAEAATRATQDVSITQAVAAETQRATQAEEDLSDRIDQLYPNS